MPVQDVQEGELGRYKMPVKLSGPEDVGARVFKFRGPPWCSRNKHWVVATVLLPRLLDRKEPLHFIPFFLLVHVWLSQDVLACKVVFEEYLEITMYLRAPINCLRSIVLVVLTLDIIKNFCIVTARTNVILVCNVGKCVCNSDAAL